MCYYIHIYIYNRHVYANTFWHMHTPKYTHLDTDTKEICM